MERLLKGLGIGSVVVAIIAGIIMASKSDPLMKEVLGSNYEDTFRWSVALAWWISGTISGIVLFAMGLMLEYLQEITARLRNAEYEKIHGTMSNATSSPPRFGNSKASMDKLQGFKI